MSTLSKLRRLVLRQDVSVREASRRLGISRNTATKWLKDGQMVGFCRDNGARRKLDSLFAPDQKANE